MLTVGGVDLTDFFQWEKASDYVSWFAAYGALDISDLKSPTLLNPASPIRERAKEDKVMQEHTSRLKIGGEYFRTEIAPKAEDIDNL